MSKQILDSLDRQILKLISQDARIPFLEVARACNVSGAAIHQRVAKLTNLGIIKGSQFIIDPEKIGYETCAYMGLYLKEPEKFDQVVEELKKIPEVVECHYTTGGFDMYAVHNIDGLSKDFPAIWTTSHFTGTNNRVYWGKDPNYDLEELNKTDKTGAADTKRNEEFYFIKATSEINKDFIKTGTTTNTNPVYCLENTFNLANMYQGQTTRVIFKATYTPKDDKGNSLAETTDGTFYTIGNLTTILNKTKLEDALTAAAKSVLPSGYKVEYTKLKTEGSHVITLEDITDSSDKPLVADKDYSGKTGDQIVAAINTKLGLKAGRPEEMVGINTYLNGVTYYIARVKHFGDVLTPWNSGESYGTKNKEYLGRYGMLRNNWYELTVGNVYGPGYPGVPPVDPTLPDDENEKYLSVSVKILSWAKRSQKVDL